MVKRNLQRLVQFTRGLFPNSAIVWALLILVLAAVPFLPAERIKLEPTQLWRWGIAGVLIAASVLATLDRAMATIVIALEAGDAVKSKLIGVPYEVSDELEVLDRSLLRGLAVMISLVVLTALTLTLSTAKNDRPACLADA